MYGSIEKIKIEEKKKVKKSNYSKWVLGAISFAFLFALASISNNSANQRATKFDETECATSAQEYHEQFGVVCSDESYPAARGYDVVNYFTNAAAAIGSSDYQAQYNGWTFFFTTESNMKLFEQNPTSYLPQWGGYCAYGIAVEISESGQLATVESDPEYFLIYQGKLYLFRNEPASKLFTKSRKDYTVDGDATWEKFFGDCDGTIFTICDDQITGEEARVAPISNNEESSSDESSESEVIASESYDGDKQLEEEESSDESSESEVIASESYDGDKQLSSGNAGVTSGPSDNGGKKLEEESEIASESHDDSDDKAKTLASGNAGVTSGPSDNGGKMLSSGNAGVTSGPSDNGGKKLSSGNAGVTSGPSDNGGKH